MLNQQHIERTILNVWAICKNVRTSLLLVFLATKAMVFINYIFYDIFCFFYLTWIRSELSFTVILHLSHLTTEQVRFYHQLCVVTGMSHFNFLHTKIASINRKKVSLNHQNMYILHWNELKIFLLFNFSTLPFVCCCFLIYRLCKKKYI
jgi:hypothetical protein